VSGAIVSARALSVRTDERGEGRGEEEEEESLAACFNSDGKNGVNKRRTTTLQKRFKSVNRQRIFFFTRTIYSTIATNAYSLAGKGNASNGSPSSDVADASAGPTSTSDASIHERFHARGREFDVVRIDGEEDGQIPTTKSRSLWNQIPSKRRRHQPSASVVVGYAHITTDVHRVRLSRTTPSCSLINSFPTPPTSSALERRLNAPRLVSMPSRSSSVARKRPARNRRCRVMCDYTTVTRSY